jgi:YidC/Oxa1 family membrane protein insertase
MDATRMANLRPVLLITLLLLGYMLWVEWQKDYGSPDRSPVATGTAAPQAAGELPAVAPATSAADLPPADAAPKAPAAEAPPTAAAEAPTDRQQRTVTARTDVLEIDIDTIGATVYAARLLMYPVTLEQPEEKVNLLHPSGARLFIAQSGLLSERINRRVRGSSSRPERTRSACRSLGSRPTACA